MIKFSSCLSFLRRGLDFVKKRGASLERNKQRGTLIWRSLESIKIMFVTLTYSMHAGDSDQVKIIDRIENCIKDFERINPSGLEPIYLIGLNYRSDWDDLSNCLETICKDYPGLLDFYLSPIIPNGRRSSYVLNQLTTDDLSLLMDIIE